MSKHLILLGLVCGAFAAQAAKVDYQLNSEYRIRGQYNHNPEGKRTPGDTDSLEHRLKLGGAAKISERFSFTGNLLHNATWGSDNPQMPAATDNTGDSSMAQHNGTATYDNMILVQEAYGSWILNESTSMRFGRSAMAIGDGTVMGKNDYLRTPNSFEGVGLNYEMDFARFNLWGLRLANYTRTTSGASDPNPQANSIGVSTDIKRLPPFLKMVNVHVMRNTKASTPSGLTDKDRFGQSGYRYGFAAKGDKAAFDYRASYAGISTNYYDQTAVDGPITKYNGDAWMLDLEGGFRLAVMDSRLFARYHMDSGDGATRTGNVHASTYDPYFYEQHGNSGLMDLIRWGNLTFYGLGFTMKPMDQLTVGIEGYIFKKTKQQDNVYAGFNGGTYLPYGTGTLGNNGQNTWNKNSSNIGTEIDVYAEKAYDGGFSVLARLGYFMAGDYLKDNQKPEAVTQAFIQGKMNF